MAHRDVRERLCVEGVRAGGRGGLDRKIHLAMISHKRAGIL
jgi:hypothetical protein